MTRNHPFEGPEVFDDNVQIESYDGPKSPWPTVDEALRSLRESRGSRS